MKTNGIDVRVLGTAFNLKAYRMNINKPRWFEGLWKWCWINQVLLHPGEQVTCIDKELRVEQVDVKPYIAWKMIVLF
ncbi:MAG: hypothetical protein ACLU4N_08720 [Butyricimonas faecihominis]